MLENSDFFGFVELNKNYQQNQLKLEQKGKNTQLKSLFLANFKHMYQGKSEVHIEKKKRLQIVIEDALR